MIHKRVFNLLIIVSLSGLSSLNRSWAASDPLNDTGWSHITFDDIPATTFRKSKDVWHLSIKASSSAMVLPFAQKRSVKRVRFQWRSTGSLQIKSAAQEKTKDGDDARLRVGLILSGDGPSIPFFAPAWIKALGNLLKHKSNEMLYLTPGMLTKPGTTFRSPYSDSIKTMSISSTKNPDLWQIVDVKLTPAKTVVGLWIMADGDNTKSIFSTEIKGLIL